MSVFTFWEGKMPAYIELCMSTWRFPFSLINYSTLYKYTDLPIDKLKRFSLPQIADIVRVHVLRDNGGYWLDTDTIVLDDLPEEHIAGSIDQRTNTIGYLHTEKGSEMYKCWAKYQDDVMKSSMDVKAWDIVGNRFTDKYVKEHKEITIYPTDKTWPETYMVKDDINRFAKYHKFYFQDKYNLSDLQPTKMLMLHNSWTPKYYKEMNKEEVLSADCTLSNILREVVK